MTKRTDRSARFKLWGFFLFVLNIAHQSRELFLSRICTADAQCDLPCVTNHFPADPDKFLPERIHAHTGYAWHVFCFLIQEQMIYIVCPCLEQKLELGWYYVKFEDNLNFCFLTNPKKFVPLSIDYGSLSLRTHFLLLFKLPALAAA